MSKTQSDMIQRLKTAIYIKKEVKHVQEYLNSINLKIVENPEELLFAAVNASASKEIFEALIAAFKKNDISLDIPNKYGRTALNSACIPGHFTGIEALIMGGANYKRMIPTRHITYLDFYTTRHPEMQEQINLLIKRRKEADLLQEKNSSSLSSLWSEITNCFSTPIKAKYTLLKNEAAKVEGEMEAIAATSTAVATSKPTADINKKQDNSNKSKSINKGSATH